MEHAEFESILEAYPVRLDNFEGPLDLLLHLIKQSEVNIYDIPIALVTRQYLDYIDLMQEMNLDVAGEHGGAAVARVDLHQVEPAGEHLVVGGGALEPAVAAAGRPDQRDCRRGARTRD